MPDFARGEVYGLFHDDVAFYVGSTVKSLATRLWHHKANMLKFPHRCVYQFMARVGSNNVEIRLLERVACDSRDTLLAAERRHIYAQNTHIAGCNQRIAGGIEGAKHTIHRVRRLENHKALYARTKQARLDAIELAA